MDIRYDKHIRWVLVRVKRKWIGDKLYNKLLDYLYPDDAYITFQELEN